LYQKDFILRMIEEFFKFLGQILKLTSEKRYDEALAAIDQAAHQFLKIDIDKIADSEDLQDDIFNKNLLSTDQLTILAELLKVKADIYKETNFDIRNFKDATVFVIAFLTWKENR